MYRSGIVGCTEVNAVGYGQTGIVQYVCIICFILVNLVAPYSLVKIRIFSAGSVSRSRSFSYIYIYLYFLLISGAYSNIAIVLSVVACKIGSGFNGEGHIHHL